VVFRLHTDGGARGNPGPAGIGVVLEGPDGRVLKEIGKGIGWATNNVAEYKALIEGLETAAAHGARELIVYLDSLLVVQQMLGKFKVKHKGLRPLHTIAKELTKRFKSVRFEAVPRGKNADADRLVNEGIDRWLEENPYYEPPPEIKQEELF
jgi:ribonuclease HI